MSKLIGEDCVHFNNFFSSVMSKKAFLIASDKSNSGKTTITTGIISALKKRGFSIAPFKCGPDYIDTFHLSRAAGCPAYNLDTIFENEIELRETFTHALRDKSIGVVEGVMGYFDGVHYKNFKGSSYEVASILGLPVLLVVDVWSSSFSAAALIKGIVDLSKNAQIKGVILNNVASEAHGEMVSKAVEYHTGTKVLGVVKRNELLALPSRHLGVYTAIEVEDSFYQRLGEAVSRSIDLDTILELSDVDIKETQIKIPPKPFKSAFIAFDKAFNFYYQHNIDVLAKLGFEIKYFSPLNNETVDNADFVYLGGGYPELFAERLSNSKSTMESIRDHINEGKPLLAECGGMIYLTKGLFKEGKFFDLGGIFDAKCEMTDHIEALGYVFAEGLEFEIEGVGHQFRYSRLIDVREPFALRIKRVDSNKEFFDGFIKNKAVAGYTHFYFSSKSNTLIKFLFGNDL